MKEKIVEVIKQSELYRLADVGYDEEFDWNSHNPPDYTMSNHLKESTQAILDLIAKELPEEKEGKMVPVGMTYSSFSEPTKEKLWFSDEEKGYNQALKEIKHKLGVEK